MSFLFHRQDFCLTRLYVSYKKREQLTTGCVVFVCYCCVCCCCYCCVCFLLFFWFVCVCISSLCVVCGVMVSVLASSVIVAGFEPRSCQTRDYKIYISKHAALRRKSKDWLARNQDIVAVWASCLYADCCLSELALRISNYACFGLV